MNCRLTVFTNNIATRTGLAHPYNLNGKLRFGVRGMWSLFRYLICQHTYLLSIRSNGDLCSGQPSIQQQLSSRTKTLKFNENQRENLPQGPAIF